LDKWHQFLEKERERALVECPVVAASGSSKLSDRLIPEKNTTSKDLSLSNQEDISQKQSDTGLVSLLFPEGESGITQNISLSVDASKPIENNISVSASSLTPDQAWWLYSLEGLLVELLGISFFMRNCICELLLRDIEALVSRYMRKMRKSFVRMHWDDGDGELELDS
jgi:hypothetical protein